MNTGKLILKKPKIEERFYKLKELYLMFGISEHKMAILRSPESINKLFRRKGRHVGLYESNIEKFIKMTNEYFRIGN